MKLFGYVLLILGLVVAPALAWFPTAPPSSVASGVTNGDSHDHAGGDGAQIDHTGLANIGTNTHAQIDTHISTVNGVMVTATNPYGTDNALIRSDSTGRGTQASGIVVDDSDNLTTGGRVAYKSSANIPSDPFPHSVASLAYVRSLDNSAVTSGNLTHIDFDDQGDSARIAWGDGRFIYLANSDGGLHTYSVDNSGNLTHVDFDDQGDLALYVWGDGRFIYLANYTGGLHTYSVDSSGNLTHIDSDDQGDEALWAWGDGRFVYLANGDGGLHTYSVDSSGNLTHIDSDDQGDSAYAVWGDGRFVYLANYTGGLHTYSVDSSGNLTHIDFDDQGDAARVVWGDGRFIYLANSDGGLHTYSVDDSGNLTHVDFDDQGDSAYGVWGDGRFIYLANNTGGLHTYSVDNSGNLTHIDSDDQGNNAYGVWGDGRFVYLANAGGGLHTYSVDNAYNYDKANQQHEFVGTIGIGTATPTAVLHLKAGTAAAGTAPLKLTAGTNLTTPEDGAFEFDGTHYYATIGSTRYQLSTLSEVTYESLSTNNDVGTGSDQVAQGSHTHTGVYESSTSNDIDVDRFAGDTTDDDLIPASLLNINSIELSYDVPDNDRSFSGFSNDCESGCTAGEIVDICDLVFMNSSNELHLADGDAAGEAPAWGYAVLFDAKTGTHNGAGNAATLSDSTASFTVDAYIGSMVYNTTDGSSCIVTDNDGTTVTCTLSGGTDNDWDASDAYEVGLLAFLQKGYCRHDAKFAFSAAAVALYLDDTPGATVESAAKPATSGDILQKVGYAYDSNTVFAFVEPVNGYGQVP